MQVDATPGAKPYTNIHLPENMAYGPKVTKHMA